MDYCSRDGQMIVAVQRGPQGTRGLYSGAMELALACESRPTIKRAGLVLPQSRLATERLRQEWASIKRVLRTALSERLALVAIGKDETFVDPDDDVLRRIARAFQDRAAPGATPPATSQKRLEVFKVLLYRWLLRQGPISSGTLAEQVGCAYPTVKTAVDELARRGAIARRAHRSVELARFPVTSWQELVVLSATTRRVWRYRDRSGEKPDAERLLRRLEQMQPPHLALGGVVAARHWNSDFDLHGTPRINLLLHAHDETIDLGFVRKVDPALQPLEHYDQSPILAVRLLQRAKPLFDCVPNGGLPFADPVETALDLYDLGLAVQANQLLAHFRPETRLS